MTSSRITLKLVSVAIAGLITLSACGGSDSGKTGSSSSSAKPGNPAGNIDLSKVQDCLEAAGIDIDLPTDMPTNMPSGTPTDMPSERPTDIPSNAGGSGIAKVMSSPEAQAALKACGIDLPTNIPTPK